MIRLFTPLILFATSIGLLAAAPAALANRGVSDQGNFFSESAEKQANAKIDDIYRNHHGQELYVETLQAVPTGQDYATFADQKTRDSRTNGVYVLIVRKGGHVHVAADRDAEKLFPRDAVTGLAKRIETNLRKGQDNYDNTLLDAVNAIEQRFQQGERAPGGNDAPRTQGQGPVYPPPAGRTPTRTNNCGALPSGLLGWACLIGGVWLVFGLIRGVFRSRAGGYGPGGGGGPGYGGYGGGAYGGGGMMGGGGGWGSSILGGMFGAVAGNWLYNHIGGGGTSYGAPPADPGAYGGGAPSSPDWAGPSDTSSGYTSGDAGGGADFAGGDSGGGGADFGGGGGGADFGGGGGDFGGGGGGGDSGGGGDFA